MFEVEIGLAISIVSLDVLVPVQPVNLDWLGPTITSIGAFIVALIGGISLAWRRRQDRQDSQSDRVTDAELASQPKVTDGWDEVRAARLEASNYYNLYRTFENLFYTVFSALRHVTRSVRDAHPTEEFAKDVLDALAIVPPDATDMKSNNSTA